MLSDEERLKHYKESLKSAWGYNDYNDWPVKFNSVMHLFLEEFAQEVLEDIEAIREQGIPACQAAAAFYNPAKIYRIINPVLYGMKKLGKSIRCQQETALYLLELVKELKFGSEFNENGTNIIWSREKLEKNYSHIHFTQADANSAALLQRFCGIMWAYTESIFFRAHDVTKEIHGPYSLSDKSSHLLVREYLNLNPSEMWKDTPLLPYRDIIVYTEYSENLNLTVDAYNHLFLQEGNYKDCLLSYAILGDGEPMDINRLPEIISTMFNTIKYIHGWTEKAGWQEITKRYADIYWYRKKALRDLRGLDWRVPQNVYAKIDSGEKDIRRKDNLDARQIDRLIQLLV
ncbi:hypothetical protein R2R35_13570 [Anaerocolumna sp. AGMB13020]|uniref:hypothetical protein n=1 Tax=Anaerocolumna sp. AGMB13020 TaxID=3081750 RepID=UPI00295474B8|nr:hypothetical protein [Anaerocolumna sp. AGMB13020]WOO34828.1 hypothetical protein R2R35_13570 [Anaerocolumna sp. AGMB13020]